MLDHDPEDERAFARRREKVPSIFAFHGTSTDCIFSMQRNGLRNLSNSQFMQVGAVHGAGIYISAFFNTAAGYSRSIFSGNYRGNTSEYTAYEGLNRENASSELRKGMNELHTKNLATRVVIVIELINHKNYNKQGDGNILVVTDQDDIMIRYYLIEHNNAAN